MNTSLPVEVYVVWGLVMLLIVVCCIALFIWIVSAIGEKSNDEYEKIMGRGKR
jgi:cell division protein FtsW (lipid II flippase)